MRPPRGLSREEAELWGRVARTVKPLMRRVPTTTVMGAHVRDSEVTPPPTTPPKFQKIKRVPPQQAAASQLPQGGEDRKPRPLDRHGLDGSWERKLAKAEISPDFTLDLHGHTLDAAHARLDHGLAQAVSLGARLVLVITGKPRPVEASRSSRLAEPSNSSRRSIPTRRSRQSRASRPTRSNPSCPSPSSSRRGSSTAGRASSPDLNTAA